MTIADWVKQGELLGSMTSVKDWAMTTQGATSNPGTVQIHIDRALAKAKGKVEINRKAGCQPCSPDPIVYNIEYHAALTNALRGMWVG